MHNRYYNTNHTTKQRIIFAALLITALAVGLLIGAVSCRAAEDELATCWILCKPGSQVNVRRTPSKNGMEVGFLEVGDSFRTDGTSKNGYIRCYGIGEYGEGWIYSGYVATEEPQAVYGQYVCVATRRAAVRKWISGPQVANTPWLVNGSNVQVFHIADGWACTNRGYIQAEWLEANPE